MENKIQELTAKIYHEGVEKGNAEAERLVANAKEEAAQIKADAQKQADDIIANAKKQAGELDEHTKSELKMYTAQSVNALKSEIANLVSDKVVDNAVADLAADKTFLNSFMLTLATKWSANEPIVISTADAQSLSAFFATRAKSLLDKGVKIEQVNGQKAFFTVQPVDGSYKVEFGEEEFQNYFKEFLRPQLVKMLFN